MAKIPRSLDEGGRLASAGQGAATARRVARRTFDVDVTRCTGCAGRMTVRAVVTDPGSWRSARRVALQALVSIAPGRQWAELYQRRPSLPHGLGGNRAC